MRDKAVMRKLDMFVADFPGTYSLMEQVEVFTAYSFPKSYNHLPVDDLML